MLAIRLARTGRHGHAQFRLVVQDSHRHPKRGKVVAYLGSYNPHTKTVQIDKEAAQKYLDNGAQPSDSAAKILKGEGVKLPAWFKPAATRKRTVRNPEKRRSTRPAEVEKPASTEEAAPPEAEASIEGAETEVAAETPVEKAEPTPAEEAPAKSAAEPEAPTEEQLSEPEAPAEEVPQAEAEEPPTEAAS